ncbi:MAG: hypothetical protein IK129_07610 [Deltaproteobacteria bacterium]|nr:hypothetical protein [Deltaproteobacteria bacterium]
MARPRKKYNPQEAKLVQVCAQYGEPEEDIAGRIDMSVETMHRLYQRELKKGKREAHLSIRKTLFDRAKAGHTAELLFYCKTQLGMRETSQIEMTSPDGSMTPKGTTFDLSSFTPEQLIEMGKAAFRGE